MSSIDPGCACTARSTVVCPGICPKTHGKNCSFLLMTMYYIKGLRNYVWKKLLQLAPYGGLQQGVLL